MATKTRHTGSAAEGRSQQTNERSQRGTAAGLRAGAGTRTEARKQTSTSGKQSRKEETKRGGPGRAGTKDGTRASERSTPTRSKATRGRGQKARAGA